jgi:putative ABC transport system permease protein
MLKTIGWSMGLMILFAGVIAFGSMVNNSLVEIGDRLRDICTFRVLGYTPTQIAGVFFRQNMIVGGLGLLLSLPLGYGLVVLIVKAYDTELFRMPVMMRAPTVFLAAAVSAFFVLISQLFVYRHIRKLNWREGVQVKE